MHSAREVDFQRLAGLPLVQEYEEAFRKLTGLTLQLLPLAGAGLDLPLGTCERGFCRLMAAHASAAAVCFREEAGAQCLAGRTGAAQTVRCFAGLSVVAVPVLAAGQHVATWLAGRVFSEQPTRADFEQLARQLTLWGFNGALAQIERAFFEGRVVSAEQLGAMRELLVLFARHLGECAERLWAEIRPEEPQSVTRARQFIQSHVAEPMALRQVAAAVHLSPYHFCRVFRAATGITLMDYISRVRVEEAKRLLADHSARVSEVAFAAGFGSVPHFNTVFRKRVGMSPTQYRAGRAAAAGPGPEAPAAQALSGSGKPQ